MSGPWICPRCDRVWAPFISQCEPCNANVGRAPKSDRPKANLRDMYADIKPQPQPPDHQQGASAPTEAVVSKEDDRLELIRQMLPAARTRS